MKRGAIALSLGAWAAVLAAGCHGAEAKRAPAKEGPMPTQGFTPASDGRLELQLAIDLGVSEGRVPMRTARLRFRNLTSGPLRVYLPPEPFRAGISTLVLRPAQGAPLLVPEPRPHGVKIGEADFPELGPGEVREFEQSFTLDPFAPGGSTARRPGFAEGARVEVSWTYENAIQRWPGGVETLDGKTQALFGGGDIPHIWLGKLTVQGIWIVSD